MPVLLWIWCCSVLQEVGPEEMLGGEYMSMGAKGMSSNMLQYLSPDMPAQERLFIRACDTS